MLATIVDTKDLVETVGAALIAGVGITFTFSLIIFGAARAADMSRADRPVLAFAAGTVAVLALVVTLAGIALGLVVMLQG